jgi:hypothetical protein
VDAAWLRISTSRENPWVNATRPFGQSTAKTAEEEKSFVENNELKLLDE